MILKNISISNKSIVLLENNKNKDIIMTVRFDNTSVKKIEKTIVAQNELISTHVKINNINEEIIELKDGKIKDLEELIIYLEQQIKLLSEIVETQKEILKMFGF